MKLTKLVLAGAVAAVALAGAAQAEEKKIEEFRIGLLGGENAQDRLRSNECLREKTEELLGVPTKLYAPADYNGVIEGLLGGNLDLAWLGASGYAKVYLTEPDAVEPVLVKINTDGSFGYHSFAFARKESGITSLEDAEGKEFKFGDPNSTSGYLIPSIELSEELGELEEYFGEVGFTGGHEQSIVAVYNGDVDVSVTWADGLGNWEDGFNSGAFRKAVDAGLVDMTELTQVWKSNVIPEGPIVLRKDLPTDVKLKMTGLMASLESMDPECAYGVMAGEVKGIAPIDHSAYKSVIEARKRKSQ
jgi:phosphonate transport system substrate-binding protein